MEQYNRLADEGEDELKHHNLRSVFRSIHAKFGNPAHSHNCNRGDVPIVRPDGQLCRSVEETMESWRSHYTLMY